LARKGAQPGCNGNITDVQKKKTRKDSHRQIEERKKRDRRVEFFDEAYKNKKEPATVVK
jgi:hypothetical protein